MTLKKLIAVMSLTLIMAELLFADDRVVIWGGHHQSFSIWTQKQFSEETSYKKMNDQGMPVIQAKANNSASGLYKEIDININEYPYLHWRWKIKNKLKNTNEKAKEGDDFAARVYVIASTEFFFWNKKVICYVWASEAVIGYYWDNPFAGRSIKQYVLKSNMAKTDTWYAESRDIKSDFKRLFNIDVNEINDIAIMTDTDNTHLSVIAWYSDIYFSRD